MARQRTASNARGWLALAIAGPWLLWSASPAGADRGQEVAAPLQTGADGYQFVCDDEGTGLSVVDVLQATGDHERFLSLFGQHDPEGFAILSDPELADKTVWAPTDAAFSEVGETLSSLSDTEITAILGYHITPPRRTPEGPYPIITPQFLSDGGEIVHQTRTGITTGSDQRIRTRVNNGALTVEDATILPTAWCTQTGSVFSIDTVITDASAPSLAERVLYAVFFKNPLLPLFGLVAVVVGSVVYRRRRTAARPAGPPATRTDNR